MLRQTFLFLSRQKNLRRWMETSSSAQGFTRRFVAGQTLDDVLAVGRKLHAGRILCTLDHLGENVSTEFEAAASFAAMHDALDRLASAGFPATISIKLTQMGLDLSENLCLGFVRRLAECAAPIGSRVEIDMESTQYTDATLRIVEAVHAEFGCVRSVLQAYLYRTEADIRRLNQLRIPVRLCKGAYDEPAQHAFPRKEQVDENYLKLTGLLLAEGAHPAIATHDPRMIEGALAFARQQGRQPGDFEFQMLYGVRRDLQDQLVKDGWALRLYVPYGDAWYPYFMRRLAERPANVLFIARNLLRA
jgi:proline dehydrogenase